MVTRFVLEALDGRASVDLTELRDDGGLMALSGMSGRGMPGRTIQWSRGAGRGARFRGARLNSRVLTVPLIIAADDRDRLRSTVEALGMLLLDDELVLRQIDESEAWTLVVSWSAGGDWQEHIDTDQRTWLLTTIELTAGDPLWLADTAEQVIISPGTDGRGLIGPGRSLSKLMLSDGQAGGHAVVTVAGSAPTFPTLIVTGPASSLTAIGPRGETYTWAGYLPAGVELTFEHETARVTDQTGASRYPELGPVPDFWALRPGEQAIQAVLTGSTSASRVTVAWRPRAIVML